MERNYVGQGNYSGNNQSNMISSGRRAGMVRPKSGEDGANIGYSSHGSDAYSGGHAPRFGRRASPGSTPTGGGMDMDPPKFPPSGSIPRGGSAAVGSASGAAAAGAAAGGSGSAGGMNSKLAGLQRLKEASTARLVSRIPSANGRTTAGDAGGGYVPSAMTNPQPTRALPARTNSGGRSGSFGSSSAAGAAAATGYGSRAGQSSSSARSASTGPAMAAGGRPPSGRNTSGTAAAAAAAAAPSGYGSSSARQQPSYGASSSAVVASGGLGRNAAGSSNGDYYYVGSSSSSGGGRQPAAAPAVTVRQQLPAAPPPAPRHPPPAPEPQPRSVAPRVPPPPDRNQRSGDGLSFGGSGGGFGGGDGFSGGGGIPPGAEEAGPTDPLVECPTCGRNFNMQAYSKHAKVCEKVFATKRKPVNMAAKRLEGSEAVKFFDLRKGVPKSEAKPQQQQSAARGGVGRGGGAGLDDRPLPGSKVPKWKAQSEQLRAAMTANRQIVDAKAKGMDIKDIKFDSGPAAPDDRIQCPHCGRKFAELTAERHIPKCKDIMAKPGRLAAGGGRGAHMRR